MYLNEQDQTPENLNHEIRHRHVLATPNDLEVVVTREFHAPRKVIFDCHIKPELVRQWLIGSSGWTMPVCEIDANVGGNYKCVWRKASGTDMGKGGVFREINEPARIVSTQLFNQDWTGGETIGTLVLSEADGKTKLVNTVVYSSKEARDGALSTGMTEGMSQGYEKLDALVDALLETLT